MNRMSVGNSIVGQQQQQPGNVMMSRMTLRPQMARPAGTNTLAYQQPGQQINLRMTLAKGPNGPIQIGQLQQQQQPQQQSQVAQQLAQQIAASGNGPQTSQNRLFEQHKRLLMQQQQQQIVAAGNEQQFSYNDNINDLLNSPGVPNAQVSMKPRQMMVVDTGGVSQNQMSPRGHLPPQSPAGIAQLSPSPVQVSSAGGGRIYPSPQNVVTGQSGSALSNRLNFKQNDVDSIPPPASPLLQGSPHPPNNQQQTSANIQQWQQQASPAQSSGGRLSAGPVVGIPSPSDVTNFGQGGALGFRSGQQSPSSTTQVSSATIIQQQQPNNQGPNGQQILSLQKTNPMLNAQLSGKCYIVLSVCVY